MVALQTFAERLGLPVLVPGGGLQQDVRWVHVSELPDPAPYLRGGEFLLSAGTNLRPADSPQYVRSLVDAGVLALGVGVTPVLDEVPAELVGACAEHGLTLLEVPAGVPFLAVSELLYEELAAAELRGLKRLADAQRAVIQAAGGPAPIRTVVDRLAEAVDGWVVLVDRNVGRRWEAGDPSVTPEVLAELDRVAAARAPTSAALTGPGQQVEVQWLSGPVRSGYALAVGWDPASGVVERAIVGVAASALSLLFTDPEPEWSAGELGAAALSAVLAPREAPARFGATIGDPPPAQWRVAVGTAPDEGPDGDASLGRRLSRALRSPFVRLDAGRLLVLLDGAVEPAALTAAFDDAGVVAGVSAPHPWSRLAAAAEEAGRAHEEARLRGATSVHSRERTGLAATVDPGRAGAFSSALLEPLLAAGGRIPDLVPTLRTWLAHHGNWDRSAVALGVHRNTVRHRIAQAERLLALDLADAQARMELWFALQWHGSRPEAPDGDADGEPLED
ncbi:PucR family transcriptional regulator [Blastococcus sp. SYSU D00820]